MCVYIDTEAGVHRFLRELSPIVLLDLEKDITLTGVVDQFDPKARELWFRCVKIMRIMNQPTFDLSTLTEFQEYIDRYIYDVQQRYGVSDT